MLREHFSTDHRSHQSDWLRQQQWFIKSLHEQEKRNDKAEKLQDDFLSLASEVIAATELQIRELEVRLKTYHEATTAALIDNRVKLDIAERQLSYLDAKLHDFLEQGLIMEDGRRVFLTADRSQAFDEFGAEVSNDEFDYDQFPEHFYPVDSRLDDLKARGRFTQEIEDLENSRDRIHEFENFQNEALEKIEEGNLTEAELEDLSSELDDLMPPEVAERLPNNIALSNAPDATAIFTKNANPVATAITPPSSQISTYDPMA